MPYTDNGFLSSKESTAKEVRRTRIFYEPPEEDETPASAWSVAVNWFSDETPGCPLGGTWGIGEDDRTDTPKFIETCKAAMNSILDNCKTSAASTCLEPD